MAVKNWVVWRRESRACGCGSVADGALSGPLSPLGGERDGGEGRSGAEGVGEGGEDRGSLVKDLQVREAKHADTALLEIAGAVPVSAERLGLEVLAAVEFDSEARAGQ